MSAREVVQVYVSDLEATAPVPHHRLAAFQSIHLRPGQSKRVSFTIGPQQLSFVDDQGHRRLEPGAFRLTIGGCSPGARGLALGASPPVSAEFTLRES